MNEQKITMGVLKTRTKENNDKIRAQLITLTEIWTQTQYIKDISLEVLMAVAMKITVFWYVFHVGVPLRRW